MTVSNSNVSARLPISTIGIRQNVAACLLCVTFPMSVGFFLSTRKRKSLTKLLGISIFGVVVMGMGVAAIPATHLPRRAPYLHQHIALV
jgi:hypothetical protein